MAFFYKQHPDKVENLMVHLATKKMWQTYIYGSILSNQRRLPIDSNPIETYGKNAVTILTSIL